MGTHVCSSNYEGSAAGMESHGTVKMFNRLLDHGLRYRYLISDGDSKSHSFILEQQLYGTGEDNQVEKKTALGTSRRGWAMHCGSSRGGTKRYSQMERQLVECMGCLTETLMNSFQNYYGLAIRSVGDVDKMMRAVQASLLHLNSTDESPHHHLCPPGEAS